MKFDSYFFQICSGSINIKERCELQGDVKLLTE